MSAMHPFPRTIVVPANSSVAIDVVGRQVACLSATADFRLRFDSGPEFDFFAGSDYIIPAEQPDYRQVIVVNPTGSANTIQLVLGSGLFRDRRLSVSGTMATSETKAATLTGSGDAARATAGHDTIAANTDRRELFIQADADNTGALYLRDGAGNAFARLDAGQSMTVTTTGAVQVRNDSGAAQTYRYVEVAD